jgi:hypothetical protein
VTAIFPSARPSRVQNVRAHLFAFRNRDGRISQHFFAVKFRFCGSHARALLHARCTACLRQRARVFELELACKSFRNVSDDRYYQVLCSIDSFRGENGQWSVRRMEIPRLRTVLEYAPSAEAARREMSRGARDAGSGRSNSRCSVESGLEG